MYKIGMIGDFESVSGFMAAGFSVREAEDAESAASALKEMAESGEFAVLFVVEDLAKQIAPQIALYTSRPLPAVIVIPGKDGGDGYGMREIKKSVEKAVGADILFK